MTTKHKHDKPILVTGAAGAVGGIGRNLTEFLLARGHKVRALVRREDKRAEALRRLGAEVGEGDLTDLASMHRAIEGCGRICFGMSVSLAYLQATVNSAALAPPHCAEAFVTILRGPQYRSYLPAIDLSEPSDRRSPPSGSSSNGAR